MSHRNGARAFVLPKRRQSPTRIKDLYLKAAVENALLRAGVETVAALVAMRRSELLRLPGLGRTRVGLICSALSRDHLPGLRPDLLSAQEAKRLRGAAESDNSRERQSAINFIAWRAREGDPRAIGLLARLMNQEGLTEKNSAACRQACRAIRGFRAELASWRLEWRRAPVAP